MVFGPLLERNAPRQVQQRRVDEGGRDAHRPSVHAPGGATWSHVARYTKSRSPNRPICPWRDQSCGRGMRPKAGIVIGACAALVLAGSAGAATWNRTDEGRPVGTWHEPPAVARTPVAVAEPAVPAAPPSDKATTAPHAAPPAGRTPSRLPESATAAAAAGRQTVGELLPIDKLLGYGRREKFSYPGASYVKLHFNRMAMLPGDYLTVSNPSGTESYRYDAPGALSTAAVDRWAMSVTGDTAVLEMHRAADPLGVTSLLGSVGVHVDRVARGFSRTEQARQPQERLTAAARTGREESVCGADETADAVCYKSAD